MTEYNEGARGRARYWEQRAQRAEAECERLRELCRRIAYYAPIEQCRGIAEKGLTPPPEGEPDLARRGEDAREDAWLVGRGSIPAWASSTEREKDRHEDEAAVDRFAEAMKAKLAKAREKGRGGWDDPEQCNGMDLALMLIQHLRKGNDGTFEDVANFAMMLHQRGEAPETLARAWLEADKAASDRGYRYAIKSAAPEQGAECPCCSGRGKLESQKERYRVMNAMIQQWSVSEQAHGDALAALDRTQYRRWKDRGGARGYVCGDVPVALLVQVVEDYRRLTASGVPEGWKWQTSRDVTDEYVTSLIAPDGTTVYVGEDDKAVAGLERLLSANSGVPERRLDDYEVRAALAEKEWITECARYETSKFGEWMCDWYSASAEADRRYESALASAPAVPEWVRRTAKETLDYIGWECRFDHHGYCQEHGLQDGATCFAKGLREIAAAPTDGGE